MDRKFKFQGLVAVLGLVYGQNVLANGTCVLTKHQVIAMSGHKTMYLKDSDIDFLQKDQSGKQVPQIVKRELSELECFAEAALLRGTELKSRDTQYLKWKFIDRAGDKISSGELDLGSGRTGDEVPTFKIGSLRTFTA